MEFDEIDTGVYAHSNLLQYLLNQAVFEICVYQGKYTCASFLTFLYVFMYWMEFDKSYTYFIIFH